MGSPPMQKKIHPSVSYSLHGPKRTKVDFPDAAFSQFYSGRFPHCVSWTLSISVYRAFHQLADLGWVDFDLDSYAVCPILLGLMGIWQNWLSNWHISNILVNPSRSAS